MNSVVPLCPSRSASHFGCTPALSMAVALAWRRSYRRVVAGSPARVLADTGYCYSVYRRYLRRRGIPHTLPERADHQRHRAHRPGRPPAFDAEAYKRHNVVGRCVNRLKQCRALATRYEKTAAAYHALVTLTALTLWHP